MEVSLLVTGPYLGFSRLRLGVPNRRMGMLALRPPI